MLFRTRTPASDDIGISPCHGVGIRIVVEEDPVADVVLLAAPQLPVLVIWAHYYVAVLRESHRLPVRELSCSVFV